MTKNLKPITLPIDPAKAHLYVARNGLRLTMMEHTNPDSGLYPWLVRCETGDNGYVIAQMTTQGEAIIDGGDFDLTHEIIPEPEAQGLDWSGVIDKLLDNAVDCQDYYDGYDISGFCKLALATLQEFERECIQTIPVCISDEKDSNKPEESAPTEEPLEFIRKHIPAPKTHEFDKWITIAVGGHCSVWSSHENAKAFCSKSTIAVLHFKRTFTEGEGL